jgi:hydrogenase maturation protease
MTDGQPGTLVLGAGNPIMGDDGLGLVALEALAGRWTFDPPVELVDGGTWGMNLLPLVESCRRLLILDAVMAGRPPGSLVVLEDEEVPRYLSAKLSPHEVGLRDVLALARLRGTSPESTVVVGVEVDRVELSTELSPAVGARVDEVVGAAVARLERWGHHPMARAALVATE